MTGALPTWAMILAAGRGTRLHPLTETVPKCLAPIGGRPLLEHTVAWLARFGVTDLVVNLHHLPEAVAAHFGDGSRWGTRIVYSPEPELLGTAGALRRAADLLPRHEPFFVWFGDNLSRCRLDRLWAAHRAGGGLATMALYERADPTRSGIVGLDGDRIVRFLEKPRPEQVFSHWVNAGILVLEPAVLNAIPATGPADLGRDVFPALLTAGATLTGYRLTPAEGLWWIDTPDDLQRVQAEADAWDAAGSLAGYVVHPVSPA